MTAESPPDGPPSSPADAAAALVNAAEKTAGLAAVRGAAEALREPLSLITGPTQMLLQRSNTGDPCHDELLLIARNCELLLNRVDDLYAAVRAASKARVGFKRTGQVLARNLADLVQTGRRRAHYSSDEERFRVLVVDDCADTRLFVSAVLEPFVEVLTTDSASQALALLRQELTVDVVVSDVMMPVLGGDELANAIRRDPDLMDVGVLLLTGRSDPEFRAAVIHEMVDDYLVKPFDTDELTARTLRLARDARARRSLRRRAMTDELTALPNRSALVESLDRHVRLGTEDVSVVMLDIDHFKRVNDGWGHAVGDEVLRQVAQTLRRHTERWLRPSAPGDEQRGANNGDAERVVGRFGGEEFVLILPHTPAEAALACAEALVLEVARSPVMTESGPLLITLSAGVATLRPSDPDWSAPLARADLRLYQAKDAGRNRACGPEPTP